MNIQPSTSAHRVGTLSRTRGTVAVVQSFPVPVGELWDIAGHPAKVCWAVPMLERFHAPANLNVNTPVTETHTILGWPQDYEGAITDHVPGRRWAMSSHPLGFSLFPLPHEVQYAFRGDQTSSSLTLTCTFDCGGLLALPFGPRVVRCAMKRSLSLMLMRLKERVRKTIARNIPARPLQPSMP